MKVSRISSEEMGMATITLANWGTRFWAWLIDLILVSVILNLSTTLLRPIFPFSPVWNIQYGVPFTFDIGLQGIVLFFYWVVFEGYHGKSIGKMAMSIRMTGRSGEKIGFGTAAIESFGKAFLLPIDCLIGWLAMPDTKLRLFNRLSNTIVIRDIYEPPPGVLYEKEKEE
jgi:uncharacterized RDD family membrane protein YckC